MSKMVSARVPSPLYDQVSACLASMGATPSDLVNSAFEYVLKEHALPGEKPRNGLGRRKALSAQQEEDLARFFRGCTLGVDLPSDPSYAKRIALQERIAKYEDPA